MMLFVMEKHQVIKYFLGVFLFAFCGRTQSWLQLGSLKVNDHLSSNSSSGAFSRSGVWMRWSWCWKFWLYFFSVALLFQAARRLYVLREACRGLLVCRFANTSGTRPWAFLFCICTQPEGYQTWEFLPQPWKTATMVGAVLSGIFLPWNAAEEIYMSAIFMVLRWSCLL